MGEPGQVGLPKRVVSPLKPISKLENPEALPPACFRSQIRLNQISERPENSRFPVKNYVLGAVTVLISVLCVWNIIGSRNTSDERLQESREPKDSPVAETKTEREREPIVPEPGSGEGEIGLEKFDRGKIIQVARLIAAHPEIEEGHHSNIYGLFGALRKNGGVYLGRVTRLIPASEEDQVRQWGVAETAVKEALFGGQRKTLQVPYFYDDWDIFIKNGGVGGYEADSPWTSYTRNKDSLFVFVTTDGHDNRIFSEKESSDFGISRKVHSISLMTVFPLLKIFGKSSNFSTTRPKTGGGLW